MIHITERMLPQKLAFSAFLRLDASSRPFARHVIHRDWFRRDLFPGANLVCKARDFERGVFSLWHGSKRGYSSRTVLLLL